MAAPVTRRALLLPGGPPGHVSGAVVIVRPERRGEIAERLAGLAGVEVHAAEGSRIVITIEGPSGGFLGETLTAISALDGVIAANMAFEHGEKEARS